MILLKCLLQRILFLHIIQNLEVNYYIVITELFETEAYIQKGKTFIQTIFTYLRSFINKDFYPLQEKAVMASPVCTCPMLRIDPFLPSVSCSANA